MCSAGRSQSSTWKCACLPALTFAIGVEIEDAARSHHRFQGDDLIERHAEQFILIEASRWRVMRFMRTEVVVAKGEPLSPGSLHKLRGENLTLTIDVAHCKSSPGCQETERM